MLQTGQLLAPFQGLCHSAATAGSLPTPGVALPGTLASPRTGLAPAGCRELVARFLPDDHPLSGLPSASGLSGRTRGQIWPACPCDTASFGCAPSIFVNSLNN